MKPLEGLKVVDMSQFVAAPTCGRILGEWGADVIKVENVKGDPCRLNGTMTKIPIVSDDENPNFDSCNLCKRYISIDLKNPEGKAVMEKLLDTADVFIMSIRQPSAERLGLDWETVHKRWPRIVYVTSSGYGESGPMKDVGGYDYTAFGTRSGFIGSYGQAGGPPINFIPAVGDYTTAMALAMGTMAALMGREKTGEGDKVVASLYNAALYVLGAAVMGIEGGMEYPVSRTSLPAPTANSYMCSDGKWLQFCATPYNTYYGKLMTMIGREDMLEDPVLNDHVKLLEAGRAAEVIAVLEEGIAQKTSDEWVDIFRKADIPCEKIVPIQDVANDAQAWESYALRAVKYPSGNTHTLVSIPVKLNSVGFPDLEGKTGRRVGYHTREVLKEYGYTDEDLDKLVENKAIKD